MTGKRCGQPEAPVTSGQTPPLVSVVIPAYNCARYLAAAVESALAQTYPAVEVIVVDDGSTDDTADVLRRYEGRVKVLRQANKGAPAARNAGFAAAAGKYVALLDADDTMYPERLARLIPLMEEGRCDFVTSNAFEVDEERRPVRQVYPETFTCPPPDRQYRSLLRGNNLFGMIVAPTALLRRHGGLDESFRFGPGEDWDLWLRMLRDGATWGYVPEPLAEYMVRRGSLSKAYSKQWESFLWRLYQKHSNLGTLDRLRLYRHALGRYRFGRLYRAIKYRQLSQAFLAGFALLRSPLFMMGKSVKVLCRMLLGKPLRPGEQP